MMIVARDIRRQLFEEVVYTSGKMLPLPATGRASERSMSEIACSIKGDVKNIYLHPPEARIWVRGIQPCQL
jgi:hypothetical protein